MGRDGAPLTGTVLVTGAGGFVGSAVVRALVGGVTRVAGTGEVPTFADGSPVRRVVALLRPAGSLERLEELAPSDAWEVTRADITDRTAFDALVSDVRPRAILHLAAESADAAERADHRWHDTLEQPLATMFRSLSKEQGARLITTGSVAVLRPGVKLNEDSPIEPSRYYPRYAASKIREESLVQSLGDATGVEWIHLRLFYLFGRYEAPTRLLPHVVRHLVRGDEVPLSSGEQVRDFTSVEDVASAYLLALRAPDLATRVRYNIGSGRGITVREFAEIVADVVGRRDLLRFGLASPADGESRPIVSDPGSAEKGLGWVASSDTRQRIREAAAWWMARLEQGG